MAKIKNLNDFAKDIAQQEGLKKQTDIAQIKETLRIVFTEYGIIDIIKIWIKYNRNK